MTTRRIPCSCHETASPDPRLVETALSLHEHSELVLEALRTQDWSKVDALPDPDDGIPELVVRTNAA
jgi:hypothetical protein